MQDKRIKTFEGLRFFSILVIMLSHLEFFEKTDVCGIYVRFFHNPILGVDFFFILSGFGMMLSFLRLEKRTKWNAKLSFGFAKKKIRKIYPFYVISLLVCIPYLFIFIYNEENLIKSSAKVLIKFIVCLSLFQSGTGVQAMSNGINGVCWFLSTLFIIYIASPSIMSFLSNRISNKIRLIVGFVVSLFGYEISCYVLNQVEHHTFFDNLVYGSPYTRIWLVILGMFMAFIYKEILIKNKINYKRGSIFECGITFITFVWFLFRNSLTLNISFMRTLDIGVVVFGMFIFSFESGCVSDLLKADFIQKLGKISMYLFLMHYPIRLYVDELFARIIFGRTIAGAIIETIVICLLSILISIAFCKVELMYKNVKRD